jgi:collagenase-like PrtC family protease
MIARSYRGALDDLQTGTDFNPYWRSELDRLSNRGFHTGYMFQEPNSLGQNYQTSQAASPQSKFVGLTDAQLQDGRVSVEIKNCLSQDQEVEIISPDKNVWRTTVENIWTEVNAFAVREPSIFAL